MLGGKISYLISWTGHNHVSNTDCPFIDYFNNCTCYYRCLWEGEGGDSPPEDKWVLKKWFERLADELKRVAGTVEAFEAFLEAFLVIVWSVVSTILSFLGKVVGFVAKHTWALIVFVAGLICVWLMQKVKKG